MFAFPAVACERRDVDKSIAHFFEGMLRHTLPIAGVEARDTAFAPATKRGPRLLDHRIGGCTKNAPTVSSDDVWR